MLRFADPSERFLSSQAEALVNPVNCKGVMGAGLAAAIKELFPFNFVKYKDRCNRSAMRIGYVYAVRLPNSDVPKWIINFPTKDHWREGSTYAAIESGLQNLNSALIFDKIKSVAVPALGCGLGGLDWAKVSHRIHTGLLEASKTCEITVYPPQHDL
jgi:O-acetyl-ADP-ribose deacetylase (regulator of RNase III)